MSTSRRGRTAQEASRTVDLGGLAVLDVTALLDLDDPARCGFGLCRAAAQVAVEEATDAHGEPLAVCLVHLDAARWLIPPRAV